MKPGGDSLDHVVAPDSCEPFFGELRHYRRIAVRDDKLAGDCLTLPLKLPPIRRLRAYESAPG